MFPKGGGYAQMTKQFLGNMYSRGKQMAMSVDKVIRGGLDAYNMVKKPMGQILDIAAPQYKSAAGKIMSGISQGANQYSQLRDKVGNVGQAVEQLGKKTSNMGYV